MWQLVLMYVITFYGFNPFLNSFTDFIQLNIRKGKCKEISNSKNAKYLKEILTSKNKIKDEDYNYILEIFKNNNDEIKLFKN
jgi:hypothetical protein